MQSDLTIGLPFIEDSGVYLQLIAGLPSPIALESGPSVAADSRYSIFAAQPVESIAIGSVDPESATSHMDLGDLVIKIRRLHQKYFKSSEAIAKLPTLPFRGAVAGFLGYPQLNGRNELSIGSGFVGVYLWAIIVDQLDKTSRLAFHPSVSEETRLQLAALIGNGLEGRTGTAVELPSLSITEQFNPQTNLEKYTQSFDSIEEYIHSGDAYQVNLTQKFTAPCSGSPLSAYQLLRAISPGPFNAYLDFGHEALLCLSPERFLWSAAGSLETKPIKGTRLRLKDPAADHRQKMALLKSEKDRAENLMIVDLLRNDLGKVSEIGTVQVTELFELRTFSNVHHLVTTITAKLAHAMDAMDAFGACFPGGSITGAPKLRAMEIIEELEVSHRGPYCGSVFYWDSAGQMDSNIAIRTLRWKRGTQESPNDSIECWAGGGIVADSSCDEEYAECFHKIQNLLDALSTVQTKQ